MDTADDFLLRDFTDSKAERHVVKNVHVWVERVVLKDHRDIAIFWCNVIHVLTVNVEVT